MLKKCKQNSDFTIGETIIHSYYRCISYFLIKKILIKTNITPNQITIFRTILMVVSFYFFYKMNESFLIGFILFHISEMLDSTDGDLARMKNLKSEKGIWLEIFFDSILTPVWGIIGLLFAYIAYDIDNNFIYFVIWGLIGFSNNLEKTFYIHFHKEQIAFRASEHQGIYYGFKEKDLKTKIKNFIIVLKAWENQLLIIAGGFYVLFHINIFLFIWIVLFLLNQIHWIRLAFYGYKKATYDE